MGSEVKILTVAISGASGFIGSNLSALFEKSGFRVRRLTSRAKFADRNPNYIYVNWNDENSIKAACIGVNVFIHAAALNRQESAKDVNLARFVNSELSARIAKIAGKSECDLFIFLSSVAVYEEVPGLGYASAKTSNKNSENYGTTKREGEIAVINELRESSCDVSIWRIGNIVGAPVEKNADCWGLAANSFAKSAIEHSQIIILGDPNANRDFLGITAFCKFALTFLKLSAHQRRKIPRILDVTSGRRRTIFEIASLVQEHSKTYLGDLPQIIISRNKYPSRNVHSVEHADTIGTAGFQILDTLESDIENLCKFASKHFDRKER